MLNAGTVQSFATLNDQGFKSGMRNLKKQGERFSKDMQSSFDKIGRSLTSLGSKMTATISAPLMGVGALAVKTAADYEKLRTSMNILNGSVEEGARNFERLKQFSAQTPFQLADLASAQNMLQGFGMEADNAFNSIKMIGDIAAVSGGSIEGIGVAFGQAAAEGKLMTRDIRQLINQGVPAIKLLADTMGVAESEVFALAEQGEISFDILNKAFQEATSEGGMFADGMKKQSETIGGLFSTLKDNVSLALGELGDSIIETFDLKKVMADLINGIQVITQRFKDLSADSKAEILKMAGLLAASGPLLIAIGTAGKVIAGFAKLVRSQFAIITASFAAGVGIGQWFSDNWSKIFGKAEGEFTSFTESTISGMKKIIDPILGFAEAAFGMGGALDDFMGLFKDIPTVANSANKSLSDTNKTISDLSIGVSEKLVPAFSRLNEELEITPPAIERVNLKNKDLSESSESSGKGIMSLTNAIGTMFERAVLHGNNLQSVLKGIAKQLAAKAFVTGLGSILTGGASLGGGSFLSNVFGGLFHSGGMVPGSGDKMIRAKGGEMVLTPSQQKALSMGGGQSVSINPNAIGRAVGLELDKRLNRLSPEDVFVLSRRGSYSY